MTALAMFGERGIDGVKLRRISAQAGSANTAAVHYHFKNKSGLIQAIIDFLEDNVWRPAVADLEAAISQNPDIRQLLYVGLWPQKRIVFDFPWGGDAQSFTFKVLTGVNREDRRAMLKIIEPHQELFKTSLRKSLPALSAAVFEQRWRFLLTESTIGQWARTEMLGLADHDTWTLQAERDYIEQYLDYVAGGLSAPSRL